MQCSVGLQDMKIPIGDPKNISQQYDDVILYFDEVPLIDERCYQYLLSYTSNERVRYAQKYKLREDRILLNNYRQMEKEKGKPWTKRLVKILEYHFDIVELKYDCIPSDESWCYLNYLETESAIFLPALSPKHDCDSDLAAFKVFSRIFKEKTIRQVYARPLIKDGGALHCATWNLYL